MVDIKPFRFERCTAFKERTDLAIKLNEIIEKINDGDIIPDSFKERIEQIENDILDINTNISEIETAISQLNESVDSRIESVNERIESVNERIDNEIATINDNLNLKSDITYVNSNLELKADKTQIGTNVGSVTKPVYIKNGNVTVGNTPLYSLRTTTGLGQLPYEKTNGILANPQNSILNKWVKVKTSFPSDNQSTVEGVYYFVYAFNASPDQVVGLSKINIIAINYNNHKFRTIEFKNIKNFDLPVIACYDSNGLLDSVYIQNSKENRLRIGATFLPLYSVTNGESPNNLMGNSSTSMIFSIDGWFENITYDNINIPNIANYTNYTWEIIN